MIKSATPLIQTPVDATTLVLKFKTRYVWTFVPDLGKARLALDVNEKYRDFSVEL
jgi:hypothetical protein